MSTHLYSCNHVHSFTHWSFEIFYCVTMKTEVKLYCRAFTKTCDESGLTRSGIWSGKGEAAACVGVDCSEAAGGGDGEVDEGVPAFEARGSATSSSPLGDGALEPQIKPWVIHHLIIRAEADTVFASCKVYLVCDEATGAGQAAGVTGSGFSSGASLGVTCSALFTSLMAGCNSCKSSI